MGFSGDSAAAEALSNLILDWPFDFILFEETAETTAEAQIMKHIINMPAATERLRDFCGLDQGNLMRIAAEVRKLVSSQTPGKVVASAADVHIWMTNPDNIRWGLYFDRSRIMSSPGILTIIDRAKCEFGRESLFEWPTKLNTRESAAESDFDHVHHGVITRIHVAEKSQKPILCSGTQGERWGDRDSPVATPLPLATASGVFRNVRGCLQKEQLSWSIHSGRLS